jgi:CHASE3 domain sensor protein
MKALAAGTHSGWTVRRLLATAILLAVSALAVIGAVSYVQITTLINARAPIERSHQVLEDIDALLTSLTSAETGQRGYLLTGDAEYLRPYAQAIAQIDDQVAGLGELVGDNPRQQATLDRLEPPVARKLAELDQTVMLRRTEDSRRRRRSCWPVVERVTWRPVRGLLSELRSAEKEVLVSGERADAAGAKRTSRSSCGGRCWRLWSSRWRPCGSPGTSSARSRRSRRPPVGWAAGDLSVARRSRGRSRSCSWAARQRRGRDRRPGSRPGARGDSGQVGVPVDHEP